CGGLGMVPGRGLAAVIRRRYSRPVLWFACALLTIANVINIGADLGGMGDAKRMVAGGNAAAWTVMYGVLILFLLFVTNYRQIARIFKWLTLVLFAYVI